MAIAVEVVASPEDSTVDEEPQAPPADPVEMEVTTEVDAVPVAEEE